MGEKTVLERVFGRFLGLHVSAQPLYHLTPVGSRLSDVVPTSQEREATEACIRETLLLLRRDS